MKRTFFYLLLLGSPMLAHADQAAPAVAAITAPQITPDAADSQRLIPLQGALNARDFAGLKGSHGDIPAASFIRTADLGHLTAADRDALAQRGLTLDVDLRSNDEATKSPDVLAKDPRFKYVRISLLGDLPTDMSHLSPSLGTLYVRALSNNQEQFRQVFDAMAAQKTGAVLYHCTAGKDRTGMITALLLDLAGVPRANIVHNYAISAYYLKPMMVSPTIKDMVKKNPNMVALMGSPASAMEAFLDAVDHQYGGARGYLHKIGVSDANVTALQTRLGQQ
jgi:protein-tyrosine phosphatase